MRHFLLTAVLLIGMFFSANSAFAEDWRMLTSDEITEALTGKDIIYKDQRNSSQSFYKNGDTDFIDGRPSQGRWRVDNNQYCSQWPPSSSWACYDVFLNAESTVVRFRGSDEVNWDGTYR